MPIPTPSLSDISTFITLLVIPMAAWGTALWLGLIIWTFKDMRARSRDPFAQIMAAFMVSVLTVPGWLIYLMLRPRETLAEAYERALEEEALLQEIEERPACPGCSRTVRDDWKVCPHCHTRLRKNCPDCDRLLELQWTLCPYCGTTSAEGTVPAAAEMAPEAAAGGTIAPVPETAPQTTAGDTVPTVPELAPQVTTGGTIPPVPEMAPQATTGDAEEAATDTEETEVQTMAQPSKAPAPSDPAG